MSRELAVAMIAAGRLHLSLFLSERLGGRSHLGVILFAVFSGMWSFCCQTIFAANVHRDEIGPKSLHDKTASYDVTLSDHVGDGSMLTA